MATEAKKVSKIDTILNKIDAFFEGLMSGKKSDDDMEEDDDMQSKKTDDSEDEEEESKKGKKASTSKKGKKAKKATDDEDSQDPDDDGDDDSDEDGDDDDDYGDDDKDKDMKKDAEIKRLNAVIAQQNQLLKEAKSQLSQTDAEVRETIKSTFKPNGSQRSTKTSAVKNEAPAWAKPTTDLAKNATKLAINQSKR